MRTLKQKLGGVFYSIVQLIVGILLLVNPIGFATGIIIALGVVLTLAGLIGIVKYFRTPVDEPENEGVLTKGLLAVLLGLFCMFGTGWLIITFPLITILYGILMLVIGVAKIQFVVDAIRRKEKRWFLGIISVVITLFCAFVVISNPFSSTAALWMFTGVSVIVDAIFDLVALFFMKEKDKEASA